MKTEKVKVSDLVLSKPEHGIHPDACLVIEFEDKGQDFTYWQLNKHGKVVKSIPFQTDIWKDTYVNLDALKVGEEPLIVNKHVGFGSMNYKIISVEATDE